MFVTSGAFQRRSYKLRKLLCKSMLLLGAAAVWGTALPVQAVVLNWTGAVSADWNNTGNWDLGQLPTLSDDATFPATIPPTGSTITLPTGAQVNNLTFNNSYTLQGGNLTFGANQNIYVPTGVTVEISSGLLDGGSGGYLKKTKSRRPHPFRR